ncbi:hypothetical protein J4212_03035 [Candidatus Woesearchaeota archaeon]|nr:hypothetical protein [Candidatus Woesearchaeota archaeon]
MEKTGRNFIVRFDIDKENIKTQMRTQNISPQEALGLLDMAKDQILDNLKKGRSDVFQAFKKDEE